MGDPSPQIGIPRQLQAMLEAARPDLEIEVVNAAMTAINSNVVLPIARDCVRHGADVLVVYMGNNEVVGPFGAGSVFGVPGATLPLARVNILAKSTRIGQAVDALVGAARGAGREPQAWTGLELFSGTRLPLGDPRLAAVHESFRRNLADIVAFARRAGVPVVLSTVAVNLRSCAPFASEPSAPDSGSAEASFREGRHLLALGRNEEAARAFAQARDADALRFRADSGIDAAIREVAAAGEVAFVDAAAAVAADDPSGVPGWEHFDDHVHLNPDGNWVVSRELARAVLPLLPAGTAAPLPDREQCRRRLGFAPHHRRATLELMRGRRARPPFTAQSDREEWTAHLDAELDRLAASGEPQHLRQALAAAREELARHPRDWDLRAVVAELLESTGDLPQAREERLTLLRRFPYSADAHYALGAVLRHLGHDAEAETRLRECIELAPSHFLARSELGGILEEAGRLEEAAAEYEAAVRAHPDGAIGFRALGDVRLELGRPEEALAAFDRAIAVNPELASAHKRRGDALARLGRKEEAIAAYREALRINPDYAAARARLAAMEARP
jgi:Flp pilus assembly protein TadD